MNIFISFVVPKNLATGELKIPLFYENFIRELKNRGFKIFAFVTDQDSNDYRGDIPSEIKQIFSIEFSVCILFNNSFWDISKIVECPIVIYDVDSPEYLFNKESIKNNIDRYRFIENQYENEKLLINEYFIKKSNILVLPFFTGIEAENLNFCRNIVFIGSRFVQPNQKTVMQRVSEIVDNRCEQKLLIDFYKEFIKDPFKKEELLKKVKFSINTEVYNYLNQPEFIHECSDYIRVSVLNSICDLGLEIYGDSAWKIDTYNQPLLRLSYNSTPVFSIAQNQELYNSSKLSININHLQARSSFSWRVFDVMASNSCLVTEFQPSLKSICKGIDLPMYENLYDARNVCKKLLLNENMRKDIVCKCKELVNQKYRFENIFDDLAKFSGMILQKRVMSLANCEETYFQLSKFSQYEQNKTNKTSIKKAILEHLFSIKNISLQNNKKSKIITLFGIRLII